MSFVKYLTVGAKALVGGIITTLLMWVFILISTFLVGSMEALQQRKPLFALLLLAFVFLNILVSGYVLNKLWSWK